MLTPATNPERHADVPGMREPGRLSVLIDGRMVLELLEGPKMEIGPLDSS